MEVIFLDKKPENYSKYFNLSVSKIKTFEQCKTKYRFAYIEKLPRKQMDFHYFGKFLHEVLENFHLKLIKNDERKYNVIMQECFMQALKSVNGVALTKEQKEEAFKICIVYLNKLVNDTCKVLSVEREFYLDINGALLLNGFIDRIQLDADGILHVSDYKTSKSKDYLKKDLFQLLIYALALCVENKDLKEVRTSYVMLKHDCELIEKSFKREQIMREADNIIKYSEAMMNEKIFQPSVGPLCKYCDYVEKCSEGQSWLLRKDPTKVPLGFIDW